MSYITLIEENAEERTPDLQLAQKKFLVTLPEYQGDGELKNNLLDIVKIGNMAPWYETIHQEIGWDFDEELLMEMKASNEEELEILDESIKSAQTHSPVTEVKDAFLRKAEYFVKIGDKKNAINTLGQAFARTIALGYQLEIVFTCIRIGFFFIDHDLIRKNLERAEEIVSMGVDYDKRNRFKIYQGFYGLITRDFKTAAYNFLSTVTTYSCYELMDYTTYIRYTVLAGVFELPRQELKQKIIENSDILEALHRIPDVQKFAFTLYQCKYADFFQSLAVIEQAFREDFILHPHYQFYVREMKIKAYSQFLTSYKSLTFSYMAQQFGVTNEFVENEISHLISIGRVYAKIDKVKDAIVVSRGTMEKRNESFNNVIRQGDLLLNRIQKLARIVANCN